MSDPIIAAARILSDQMRWIRHATDEQGSPYAVAVFAEIADCARQVRAIVEGPVARRYLGPCGAELTWMAAYCPTPCSDGRCDQCLKVYACDGNVYGRPGGDKGTCRTCGAQVDQAERRAWLDDEVRQRAFRLVHIADAYGLKIKTLRSWALRGQLLAHGHDREGRKLYLVGEVLDLESQAADRRADRVAERDRRTAARAAESESVA